MIQTGRAGQRVSEPPAGQAAASASPLPRRIRRLATAASSAGFVLAGMVAAHALDQIGR